MKYNCLIIPLIVEDLLKDLSHVLMFSQAITKKTPQIQLYLFIPGQTSAFVLESAIPKLENESQEVHANSRFVRMQTQNINYDLPQNSNYDYPKPRQMTHYEYPSVSNPKLNTTSDNTGLCTNTNAMDGVYASLNFTQLDIDDNDEAHYQSLIHVHKKNSETGLEELKRETNELSCVEVRDGEYSSLVWSSSMNDEDETSRYQSLIKNKCTNANVMDGVYASLNFTQLDIDDNDEAHYQSLIHVHKKNSETGLEELKRETNELSCVEVRDGEYSSLVWSSSMNDEDETSRYQSLIKNKCKDDN